VISLLIKNGNISSTFHFNSSSTFFVDLPSSLSVNAGQTLTVPVTVYSGCESGVVNSFVNIWAEGSSVVSVPLALNLRACYKPIVVAAQQSDVACACEQLNYSFNLYNPGNKSMTYALSSSVGQVLVDGAPASQVTLPVDGNKTIIVDYTVPCDYSGALNVSLIASAVNTCAKVASDTVVVDVRAWNRCETVSVSAPSAVPVNESDMTIPVTISKVGVRPASYNVVVTGSAVTNLLGVS